MVCCEPKHDKLEALFRAKAFVERPHMLNLKPRFGPMVVESRNMPNLEALFRAQAFVESPHMLNLKPRFGPMVC